MAKTYETDFHVWTQRQADELRRLLARGTNTALDLEHLAEEIEDLGRSERDAVRSQVRRILEHLLKLEFSASAAPRNGWKNSIADARTILEDKLTPSLRADLEAMLPRLYVQILPVARRSLEDFDDANVAAPLPTTCPYALGEILQPEWYPDRDPLD